MTISVEDRLAIHELIALHGHRSDAGEFASDGVFTAGSGPLLSGTTLALTMAMTAHDVLHELEGDGVATLRDRCETA